MQRTLQGLRQLVHVNIRAARCLAQLQGLPCMLQPLWICNYLDTFLGADSKVLKKEIHLFKWHRFVFVMEAGQGRPGRFSEGQRRRSGAWLGRQQGVTH